MAVVGIAEVSSSGNISASVRRVSTVFWQVTLVGRQLAEILAADTGACNVKQDRKQNQRKREVIMRRRDFLKAVPLLMVPAVPRADIRPLRFIPNANLSAIDPIWTTALVAQEHGYLVFDTLYGIDDVGKLRPQMCAGHELSDDKLTWTFTL